MSSITFIGTGNMARTIGTLAMAGGNTVEVMGRDQSKADDLAKALGGGTTTGKWGAVPAGDIVITALLYAAVVPVVTEYGDVFMAGDNAQAKAGVAAFIESLGLRPLDVGGLKMAHWLEGAGVVTAGLAGNGVGHWDFALGVNEFTG